MCKRRRLFAFVRGSRSARRGSTRLKASLQLAAALLALVFVPSLTAAPVDFGADRRIVGDTSGLAPRDRSDAASVESLSRLSHSAAKQGFVRIIVGVRVPFASEGLLDARDATGQRREIALGQQRVLDKLGPLLKHPSIRRFETIPFFAAEVTAAELARLAALAEVTSIGEDATVDPTLAVSGPKIGANDAWLAGYTGVGQTIAIIDDGVDGNHPFLKNKVVYEACFSGSGTSFCPGGASSASGPGSAQPYAGGCPPGDCSHGTHVAGIAAGNGIGVAAFSGIAKEASIIALQVFHRSTSSCSADTDYVCASTSDILAALEVVLSRRALYSIAAVNMSLGGGKYTTYCDSSFPSYASLISSLRSYNIPVIIASGNDYYSDGIAEPACISSAISVGATSKYDDSMQSFSNSASILTLLAPGSSIQSSVPGGGYSYKQGTSMATPHVAGAFAVLKQRNSISAISALLDVFASTGMPVYDSRNGLTRPRIQLDAAVNDILAVPPADCPATSTPTQLHCFLTSIGGTTKYKVTVTAIADGINNNDSWMALNMYAAGVPCNSNFGVHYGIDNQTKVTGTCTVMVPSRKPLDHYYGMLVNAEAPNHIADGHSITATVLPQGFTPDDVIFQDGLDQLYP